MSTNPQAAKRVILSEQPRLAADYQEVMSDDLLYTMLEEMGAVSAVYYRKAEEFITPTRGPEPVTMSSPVPDSDEDDLEMGDESDGEDNLDDDDDDDLDIFSDEEPEKKETSSSAAEPVYEMEERGWDDEEDKKDDLDAFFK